MHAHPEWAVPVHTIALDVLKGWVGVQPVLGVVACGIVGGVAWWLAKDWMMANLKRRAQERARSAGAGAG